MSRNCQTLLLAVAALASSAGIVSAQRFGFSVGPVRVSTSSFRRAPRVEYRVRPRQACPPPKQHVRPAPVVCQTPIPVSTTPTPIAESAEKRQLRDLLTAAKTAFQNKKYLEAVAASSKLIKLAPKSTGALQLRSLSYFAMGDFKQSARDAYQSILSGPIWTRAALKELYPDAQGHSRDLSWLQSAAVEQPQSLHVHFLLAYHHLVLGNLAGGAEELETVLSIKANDPVASRLLQVVKTKLDTENTLTASR